MSSYTREVIERGISDIQNLISLVAEYNSCIVGYAAIYKVPNPRRKGVSDLAMYLHQDFHNVALGTTMMNILIEQTKKENIHIVGLHVIADNKIAIHLYEKFGFKIEGVMKDAYFSTNGKYHDTIVMALTMPHNH
jgi:putative acetyltransferase